VSPKGDVAGQHRQHVPVGNLLADSGHAQERAQRTGNQDGFRRKLRRSLGCGRCGRTGCGTWRGLLRSRTPRARPKPGHGTPDENNGESGQRTKRMSHCECPFRTAQHFVNQGVDNCGMRSRARGFSQVDRGRIACCVFLLNSRNSYYKLKFSLLLAPRELLLRRPRGSLQKYCGQTGGPLSQIAQPRASIFPPSLASLLPFTGNEVREQSHRDPERRACRRVARETFPSYSFPLKAQ
jgi:hypothetical protein